MLTRLYIRNFAIISEMDLQFTRNLNILTGETGAGKSILLGAISLILGDRASTESIRHGQERAQVEGSFKFKPTPALQKVFSDNQLEIEGDDLTIRREITTKGQNRIFVNDQSATLATLKSIGDLLVDLHGQHDHQSLLSTERQLNFLDDFCRHPELLEKTETLWSEAEAKRKALQSLEKQRDTLIEKRELSEFQLKEIREIKPETDEDDLLENELSKLENAEFLFQTSGSIGYSLLGQDEGSLYHQLNDIRKKMDDLQKIDKNLADYFKEFESAVISVKEAGSFFENYSEKVVVDPARLSEVKVRLDGINRLKKKYGPTLAEVLEKEKSLELELGSELNVDGNIIKLKKETESLQQAYIKSALALSSSRKKGAEKLSKMVLEHLSELGLLKAKFKVSFSVKSDNHSWVLVDGKTFEASPEGIDFIEFMISTNAGEPVKPLAKVASGGEISRIMLAIKASTAAVGGVGVLIFDEIDTGVSGKVAFSVGKLLTRLSNDHQVFVITHLPQVASVPGDHFLVAKQIHNGSTESTVINVNGQDRVDEIAKLLSGDSVSETSRIQARELLETPR